MIISALYKTILDALFPISAAEDEMLSLSPQDALQKLPVAPGYEGLVVDLPNATSLFAYKDERVAKLVWSIKYKKSAHAVRIGGYVLWHTLVTTTGDGNRFSGRFGPSEGEGEPAASPPGDDGVSSKTSLPEPVVVMPMPITERRRRERGYNQCELIVDEMERLEQINKSSRFVVRKDILFRVHHAARQTLKDRDERIEGAKGIFAVNEYVISPELLHSHIIVIDDVITTGSTMFEALETMKKAGFEDVQALSIAH